VCTQGTREEHEITEKLRKNKGRRKIGKKHEESSRRREGRHPRYKRRPWNNWEAEEDEGQAFLG
jgi:hypothetical protein